MAESSKDEQGLGYTLREEMRQISILHLGADSIKTTMTHNDYQLLYGYLHRSAHQRVAHVGNIPCVVLCAQMDLLDDFVSTGCI
jgi:hypothetical protein